MFEHIDIWKEGCPKRAQKRRYLQALLLYSQVRKVIKNSDRLNSRPRAYHWPIFSGFILNLFQLTCQFSALTAPPLPGRPLRRRTPPAAGRPSTTHRIERPSRHAPSHALSLRGVFQGVVSGAASSAAAGRVRWRKRTSRPSRYLRAGNGYFAKKFGESVRG